MNIQELIDSALSDSYAAGQRDVTKRLIDKYDDYIMNPKCYPRPRLIDPWPVETHEEKDGTCINCGREIEF